MSEAGARSERSRLWKIAGFPIRLGLAYALLMAPWPGWAEGYGKLYAGVSAALFDSTDPERKVTIRYAAPKPGTSDAMWGLDTVVGLQIGGESVGGRSVPPSGTARSSRYTGYAPMVLAIALVVAMPIPWRRRLVALPWVALLTATFSALMLAFWIQGWFYAQECIALARTQPEYAARARTMGSLLRLSGSFGPYYIAPVVFAVLVSLRRSDLEGIFPPPPARASDA